MSFNEQWFGGQVVTFVKITPTGVYGDRGTPELAETSTQVPGCRHRPLTFQETIELNLDTATEWWKTTAPPVPAVLAATANDEIEEAGRRYQIHGGIRPFPDMDGQPYKVTIVSKRHFS